MSISRRPGSIRCSGTRLATRREATDLIELQREDYLDMRDNDPQRIQIPQEECYPIYDLLCDMYYAKYITPNMTAEEITSVADRLVDIVTYDVPEGYDIPAEYFHTAAQAWNRAVSE